MNLFEMDERAGHVSELMKILSNKVRLMTLCQLVDGEKSVSELARQLALPQPSMSQQLALLRKDGLVQTRREGQTVYYALPAGEVRKLVNFLYRTFCAGGKA